jgi:predicted RNA binding protein YcfA (HicA-like mRNA interferase family)
MTKLVILDFKTIDRVLKQFGFAAIRQKGSHVFYRHTDGRTTTVPNHAGRDISRPLLREILREAEITPDQLAEILKGL